MNTSPSILIGITLLFGLTTGSIEANTSSEHSRFSIAISGGASKGAYEAGFNWGVIKIARMAPELKNLTGGQLFPFQAESIAGASAGGINTILSGLTWCSLDEKDGGISNHIDDNVFRDIWLRVDINTLLPERADSAAYLPDDAVLSRKDFLDAALELRDRWNEPSFRKGCRVPLGVTVTRIVPDELNVGNVDVQNQRFYIPFELRVTADNRVNYFFDPSDYPRLSDPAMILMPRTQNEPAFSIESERILDAAFTTSAFPMAFGRKRLQYCRLMLQDITGEERRLNPPVEKDTDLVCPKGYELVEAEFADGGLFDNLPIGVAHTLAEFKVHTEDDPYPLTFIYIDPNRIRYKIPEIKLGLACDSPEPPDACRTMEFSVESESQLLVGFFGTARRYELYRELTSDDWQLNLSEISYKLGDMLRQRNIDLDCQHELPYYDRQLDCSEALGRAGKLLEIAYDRIDPVIDEPYSVDRLRQAGIIHNCNKVSTQMDSKIHTVCSFDTRRYRIQFADAMLSLVEKAKLKKIKIYSDIHKSKLSMQNDRILRVSSRGAPITGTLLEDFGSFLDYKFREYDYYVGVYDSMILSASNVCRLQYSTTSQSQEFHHCFDAVIEQLYTIIGLHTSSRGRYVFARLAQREFSKDKLLHFAYQPMPATDVDMRIIHDGLERALADGESEKIFFKFLKTEGFVPTSRKDESESFLKRFIPYGKKPLLEQIIDDPDSWATELTRRVTTRLVYLETQAEKIYVAREPYKDKRKRANTEIVGATAFILQSSNYRYPDLSFAPSTAPENWIWRNIIPYAVGFDLSEGDLLLTWHPTLALSQKDQLGIRGTLGFAGGLFQSSADLTRENYLAVGLDYTRQSTSPYISSYGLTPTWFYALDQPQSADRETIGGNVHVSVLKNRLRIGLGTRNFDHPSDTWYLTISITDMPGMLYWLTR